MKNLLTAVLLLLLIAGCSVIVDIDISQGKPKLVANALFQPDSVWSVSLSKSISVLEQKPFQPVGNAQINIYNQADQFVETLKLTPSINGSMRYRGNTKPAPGVAYRMEVIVSNEPTLNATNKIPEVVPILDVAIDSSAYKSNGEDVDMKIKFKDPGGETNFYEVKILRDRYYINYMTQQKVWYTEEVYVEAVDPLQENDASNGPGKLINDHLFNGKEYNFHLKIRSYPVPDSPRVRVLLLSVSESYYQYFSSQSLQNNTEGDPFAQPALVFSNIENGLGIFAGYNYSVVELK